jgi:hypothetical protein
MFQSLTDLSSQIGNINVRLPGLAKYMLFAEPAFHVLMVNWLKSESRSERAVYVHSKDGLLVGHCGYAAAALRGGRAAAASECSARRSGRAHPDHRCWWCLPTQPTSLRDEWRSPCFGRRKLETGTDIVAAASPQPVRRTWRPCRPRRMAPLNPKTCRRLGSAAVLAPPCLELASSVRAPTYGRE